MIGPSTACEIPFVKYSASGNNFIVTFTLAIPIARSARSLGALARAICTAGGGLSADGLLLLSKSKDRRCHARMRVFNADGSEAEMSGNGIRCAAAFVLDVRGHALRLKARGVAIEQALQLGEDLRFETAAGVRSVRYVKGGGGSWVFRVGMGEPVFEPNRIPFAGEAASTSLVGYPLRTSRGEFKATITSLGNPHCSVFVESFEGTDWQGIGAEIEAHPLFPNRTNVEFVRVLSRQAIEVRYWERGVGRTQSSGTGSSAAVVASVLNGRTGRRVKVHTLGGPLGVAWLRTGGISLTGPVHRVAEGVYEYRT